MNKTLKVMVICAIAALVFALPLAAQTPPTAVAPTAAPASGPESNLRLATATLYKTDVDNFLNVNNWSAVNLEKWFALVHGSFSPSSSGYIPDYNFRANLGYATKLGDGIHLGLRFYGNVFRDTGGSESVTLTPRYDEDTQQLISLTERTVYPDKWHSSANQLDVLLGLANMGFRIGFFESIALRPAAGHSEPDYWGDPDRPFSKTDYKDGNITYQNEPVEYSRLIGYIRPSLQWGALLNVNDLTLKPRVSFAFNIFQDTWIDNYYGTYTAFNGRPTTGRTLNITGQNNGYLQPIISVGADIGLPRNEDGLATTFTIDYTVNFNTYDNDYSASGFEGTAAGPVTWEDGYTETSKSIAEKSTYRTQTLIFGGSGSDTNYTTYSSHNIAPRLTLDRAVTDTLKLGVAIMVPMTITARSKDRYTEERTYSETINYDATNKADSKTVYEETVHTPYGLTEQTEFKFSPSVRVGASYALIPGRFTVNAGVQLDPCVLTSTSTTQSRNGDGVRTTRTIKNGDGVVIYKEDTTDFFGAGGYVEGNYTDSSTVNSSSTAFSGAVTGGFLFNFNENVALDLLAGASYFEVMLYQLNVMLSFKF